MVTFSLWSTLLCLLPSHGSLATGKGILWSPAAYNLAICLGSGSVTLCLPVPSPKSPVSLLLPIHLQAATEQDPRATLGLCSLLIGAWDIQRFSLSPHPKLSLPLAVIHQCPVPLQGNLSWDSSPPHTYLEWRAEGLQ